MLDRKLEHVPCFVRELLGFYHEEVGVGWDKEAAHDQVKKASRALDRAQNAFELVDVVLPSTQTPPPGVSAFVQAVQQGRVVEREERESEESKAKKLPGIEILTRPSHPAQGGPRSGKPDRRYPWRERREKHTHTHTHTSRVRRRALLPAAVERGRACLVVT